MNEREASFHSFQLSDAAYYIGLAHCKELLLKEGPGSINLKIALELILKLKEASGEHFRLLLNKEEKLRHLKSILSETGEDAVMREQLAVNAEGEIMTNTQARLLGSTSNTIYEGIAALWDSYCTTHHMTEDIRQGFINFLNEQKASHE